MDFDQADTLWQEGARRLAAADPSERDALQRVIDAVVAELRRRLGGPFTRRELAALYEELGIDWCLEIAMRLAPNTPGAWDMTTVAGAAFARYAREARDYRPESSRPPGMDVG
jgi:hypothetical protein